MGEEFDLGESGYLPRKLQRLLPGGVGFQTTVDENRDREPVLVLVGKRDQARIPVERRMRHGSTLAGGDPGRSWSALPPFAHRLLLPLFPLALSWRVHRENWRRSRGPALSPAEEQRQRRKGGAVRDPGPLHPEVHVGEFPQQGAEVRGVKTARGARQVVGNPPGHPEDLVERFVAPMSLSELDLGHEAIEQGQQRLGRLAIPEEQVERRERGFGTARLQRIGEAESIPDASAPEHLLHVLDGDVSPLIAPRVERELLDLVHLLAQFPAEPLEQDFPRPAREG